MRKLSRNSRIPIFFWGLGGIFYLGNSKFNLRNSSLTILEFLGF